MGFYENHILPRLIDTACSAPPILKQREKVVPEARGRILEIGMGSAINLPYYDPSRIERAKSEGAGAAEGRRPQSACARHKPHRPGIQQSLFAPHSFATSNWFLVAKTKSNYHTRDRNFFIQSCFSMIVKQMMESIVLRPQESEKYEKYHFLAISSSCVQR